MSSRLAALVIGCLAVVACAWFVLGAVQAADTSRATSLLSGKSISPRQAADVRSLLNTAGTLNPDQSVNLLRGQLAYQRGQFDQARGILLSVVQAEPQNLQAWLDLARYSHSEKYFRLALGRINQLLPPVPHKKR